MSDDRTTDDNITPIRKSGFQKGQSGNPAGGNKPRIYREALGQKLEIEELFRSELTRVWYELHKLIVDPKTPGSARVSAIKEYLDRAIGKTPTSVRVTRDQDVYDTIDTSLLSNEALAQIAAAKRTVNEAE